jgi:hypothetical protein
MEQYAVDATINNTDTIKRLMILHKQPQLLLPFLLRLPLPLLLLSLSLPHIQVVTLLSLYFIVLPSSHCIRMVNLMLILQSSVLQLLPPFVIG